MRGSCVRHGNQGNFLWGDIFDQSLNEVRLQATQIAKEELSRRRGQCIQSPGGWNELSELGGGA